MKKSVRIVLITVAVAVVIAAIVVGIVLGVKKPENPEVPVLVKISSEADFMSLDEMSGSAYADTVFELETDLTLDFRGKAPIFNSVDNAFCGVFDGKGHTVRITYDQIPESGTVGLFGYVYGAAIKNLTVETTLSGDNAKLADDATYIGAVAGFAFGENSVENVKTTLSVAAKMSVKTTVDINGITRSYSDNSQYVGGIFGYAAGKIKVKNCQTAAFALDASDCVSDVTTDFKDEARKALFVGGAFGHAAGSISVDGFAVSLGSVDLYAKTVSFGGLSGVIEGGNAANITVTAASKIKTVSTGKGYVGGVTGYALNTTVSAYDVNVSYDTTAPAICALSFGGAAGFIDGSSFSGGNVAVSAELDYATAFGGLAGAVRNGKFTGNTLSGGIYGVGGQSVEISGLQRLIDAKRAYFGTLVGRVYGSSEISANTVNQGYPTAPDMVGLAEPYVPVDSEGNLGTAANPVISGNTVLGVNPD